MKGRYALTNGTPNQTIVLVPDAVVAVRAQRPSSPEVPKFSIRLLHVQYLTVLVHLTGSRELASYCRGERFRFLAAAVPMFASLTVHYLGDAVRLVSFTLRAMLLRRRAVAARLELADTRKDG